MKCFDLPVLFMRSGNCFDMYDLNSLCDGVSWFWSGFLSDANLIWLTSIPMGDPFWILRDSGPLGGGCFWNTTIPRFGNMSFPRRLLSAPSVIKSFWSLASQPFDWILTRTLPIMLIVLPKPWYAFFVISSTDSNFKNLSRIFKSWSKSFFINETRLAESIWISV